MTMREARVWENLRQYVAAISEVLDDGPGEIDLTKVSRSARETLKTWTLDQGDALPKRLGFCYWHGMAGRRSRTLRSKV